MLKFVRSLWILSILNGQLKLATRFSGSLAPCLPFLDKEMAYIFSPKISQINLWVKNREGGKVGGLQNYKGG